MPKLKPLKADEVIRKLKKPGFSGPFLSQEQQRQYVGKHVALIDGKIVASGKTSFEASKRARKLFPDKLMEDIGMLYIPKAELLMV